MTPHDAGLPDPSSPLPPSPLRESNPIAGRIDGPTPPRLVSPAAPTAPGLSAAPDLMALLIALRRRWISAVCLGGTLALLASVAAWFGLTPKSVAFARLQVSAVPFSLMDKGTAAQSDFRTYMQTTAASITSRPVILGALKRDEVRRLGLDQGQIDPVQLIEEGLTTEFKENSELLTLMFTHADPKVATTVAQAVKETYLQDDVEAKRRRKAAVVTQLEKVHNEKVESLRVQKENLKKVAASLSTGDPKLWREQRSEALQELRDAKNKQINIGFELVKARAELAVFESRLQAMGTISGPVKKKDPQEVFEETLQELLEKDHEAVVLTERIARHEEIIEGYLRRGFKPDYVSIATTRGAIASLHKMLAERKAVLAPKVKRYLAKMTPTVGSGMSDDPAVIRDTLVKRVESLKTLDDSLQKDIKTWSAQVAKTPSLAVEYDQLENAIALEERFVKSIGEQLEREKVELGAFSRISNFQDADLMKIDVRKQLVATAAAPLAVIFAVCAALALMEHRLRRVRTAGEISRGLGIRVVGAIPRMVHLERHLVSSTGESDLEGTPVMESIDAIRTRLLHEADARSTRVVMVTSATAGEGKTTLASHLASSLARAGRKTLLLDGDLRRPTLHELFEVPMQPGFSEVLLGEVEVAEAAQETHQENLSVIPAGQWDRDVLLALSRDGLEGVFERLADEFDFLIIDSHPVLAATDSLLLGRQVDAVILSVLRDVSQMPRVYAAQQQMAALGIRVLGAVVNGTDPEEVFSAPPAMAHAA